MASEEGLAEVEGAEVVGYWASGEETRRRAVTVMCRMM